MENTKVKHSKKHVVLRTVLITTFVNLLIVITLIFLVIGIPRWSRPYTTYVPFSGKLFDINLDEVDKIATLKWTPGGYDSSEYTSEDDKFHEIIDFMNSFRYSRVFPSYDPNEVSGGSESITITGDSGEEVFRFGSTGFAVEGSWYYYGYFYYPEKPIDFEDDYLEIANQPPRVTQSPKPLE